MYWNNGAWQALLKTLGWIVTLDVLKFRITICFYKWCQLNSNIRCIEMNKWNNGKPMPLWLNSNIRCIEIENGVYMYED